MSCVIHECRAAIWSGCVTKQVAGHCGLVGGAFSGSPPGLHQWVGSILNRAAHGKPVPLDSSVQVPDEYRLILPVPCWLSLWQSWLVRPSLSRRWTVLLAMMAESVWWGWWVVVTFVTHQAKTVVHCLQAVNNCSLILTLLPTPGAVGQIIEVAKGIWVMYANQSHNLWGLWWGHCLEELDAFW